VKTFRVFQWFVAHVLLALVGKISSPSIDFLRGKASIHLSLTGKLFSSETLEVCEFAFWTLERFLMFDVKLKALEVALQLTIACEIHDSSVIY
jgi:hypothetical protein